MSDLRWKQNKQRGVGFGEFYIECGILKIVVDYEGDFMSKGWEWEVYMNRNYGKKGSPGTRLNFYGTRRDFVEKEQAQRYAIQQFKKYFRPIVKKFFDE